MMRFLVVTLILQNFFCAASSYAQDSTKVDWREFYPLHIGDFWKYLENPFQIVTTREVVDYELLPNGKEYAKILDIDHSMGGDGFDYERVDSLGNVYGYYPVDSTEVLMYKLDVEVGDTWVAWFDTSAFWQVEEKITEPDSNGVEFTSLAFDLKNFVALQFISLVEGLGVTFIAGEVGVTVSLQGAVINGIVHGDTSIATHVRSFEPQGVPAEFSLENAYPTPFTISTQISYRLKRKSEVKISIVNVRGELVRTIVNQTRRGGEYDVRWNGRNAGGNFAAAGLYFVVLRVGRHSTAQKIIFKR